jgi:hypothetical protein
MHCFHLTGLLKRKLDRILQGSLAWGLGGVAVMKGKVLE